MDNNIENKRYDFVDLLKTIAILFVLIYHLSSINIDFLHYKDFNSYFNYYLSSILSTCVPIFFLVNGGLLLNKSHLDIKKHGIKIIKILLLTIVWAIITLILLSLIKDQSLSLTEYIKGVYYFKHEWNNHLWFFQALFIVYIFYPLLFNSLKTLPKAFYFFAIAVFVFTFLNTLIGQLAKFISINFEIFEGKPFESINYFSDFNAFRGIYGYAIGYFILGGILFNYQELLKTKKAVILSIIALPVSMGLLSLYGVKISESYNELWDIVWNGYDSMFTLINVIIIFTLSLYYKNKGAFGKLVKTIAENSLGIYLIHIIIGTIVNPFIPITGILGSLIMVLASLFISLFIALTIKKIPLLRHLLSLQ